MCLRVRKFYRQNEKKLDAYSDFPDLIRQFNRMCDELEIQFENSVSYNNGYSIERARKREDLQSMCIRFTGHLKQVQAAIKYKPSKALNQFIFLEHLNLNRLDEEELIQYAAAMYDICEELESRLKTIGVFQKAIERFSESLTLFALDFPMSQLAVNKRKTSNLLTLKALEDLDDFLTEQMDRVLGGFEKSEPELFRAYLNARRILPPEPGREPDYTGVIEGNDLKIICRLPYDIDREILLKVEGGNAIWGLSNNPKKIEYSRPVRENEELMLKCRVIGNEGDHLMIQSVKPENIISYQVWYTEVL